MRKTLFALAFLAASALSNGAVPVYSWEWTAEGANINADGWGNSFSYTEGNDYASFSGTNSPWNASISSIPGSFTISFDLKGLSIPNPNYDWDSILSMYSNGTTSGNDNSLQLQFNASGDLMLYNKIGEPPAESFGGADTTGTPNYISTGVTSADLQQDVWTSFSIVSDLDSQKLSVYVNGALAGSITNWEPASPALTGAQFGCDFGENPEHALSGSIKINNIKFYNEAVLPVPEPAAASLSLLGLAALMMRRRRA